MLDLRKVKAVFFDMDGVLYDSMKNHEHTWVESFKSVDIDFPAEESYMNEGRTGFSTINYAYEKFKNRPATLIEQQTIYALKTKLMGEAPKAELLAGMQQLVNHLQTKGVLVMVVTGSKQPSLVDKLSAHFNVTKDQIVSGADVKIGKPHPEPYLMALTKSGFEAHQCVVIENAPLGIQSAKAAGIYTVAVNTGILNNQILIDHGADELHNSTQELVNDWLTNRL